MTSRSGFWISIDGADGSGKTTVASGLAGAVGGQLATEFSDSPAGTALRSAVKDRPNYIGRSLVGQSLAFLGDFFEVYETQVCPALDDGRLVVSDRGWLSKYAFQFVTLAQALGDARARGVLENTLGLMPRPDLTVYLDGAIDVFRARIERRDGICEPGRTAFNDRATAAAESLIGRGELAVSVVDATLSPDRVLALADAACAAARRRLLSARPHRWSGSGGVGTVGSGGS